MLAEGKRKGKEHFHAFGKAGKEIGGDRRNGVFAHVERRQGHMEHGAIRAGFGRQSVPEIEYREQTV